MQSRVEVQDHAWELRSDAEAAEIDDTLWWAVGRREMIAHYVRRASQQRPVDVIVEIGCGSGGDLPVLARFGSVIGVERSTTLARRARERQVAEQVLEADFFELESPLAADLYCLFDVLEHIEQDGAFLRRLAEAAGPGRLLLLSVPACPALYSRHDELLHHYRRYRGSDLVALLEQSGFEVLESSSLVLLLLPLVAASRMHEKLLAALGRPLHEVRTGEVPGWLNALLTLALRLEVRIAQRVRLPIGLWFFALARVRTPDASPARP